MFTGITGHVGAVVATIVVLTGGAALRGGVATADPNQDEQFKALLNQEDIPALEGVPTLINTARKICLVLDRGIPVDTIVDAMMNNAYTQDPAERLYPPARLESTMTRFITASVEAYCPRNQRKIASIMANPAPASDAPMNPTAAYLHRGAGDPGQKAASTGVAGLPRFMDGGPVVAVGAVRASLIRALPSGDMTPPTPPQIPPPPPQARLQAPPRPIAAPPAPKRPPPPPQQPPPPPQQPPPPPEQMQPPAIAPQPGGDAGSGGGGSTGGTGGTGGGIGGGGTGGGGPVKPAPAPAMPPGFVRLAP